MPINLHEIYHASSLIANLVSGNLLFKKGFYFHGNKCTLRCISDNQEVAYSPMIDGLFALQMAHTSLIALLSHLCGIGD